MKARFFISTLFLCCVLNLITKAQYAPEAGQPGSTAISQDTAIIRAWGMQCQVKRGLQNISKPSAGYATVGSAQSGVGKADNNVVSLGDRGEAIVTFDKPISDGPGWDFAVFENSFSDYFLELAFVEVSSDGVHYYRFESVSLTNDSIQTDPFGITAPVEINNLAGKYRGGYGTPFDLAELANKPNLDIYHITHVKVIDVVGSIQDEYASFDSRNHKINDPWPTEYPSSGFDLDAVAVLHQAEETESKLEVYPIPCQDNCHLLWSTPVAGSVRIEITDAMGQVVWAMENQDHTATLNRVDIDTSVLQSGYYLVTLRNSQLRITRKLIKL